MAQTSAMHRSAAIRAALLRILIFPALAMNLGCAQTVVQPIARSAANNLPPPARILIYDYAFSVSDVSEYQGIMRQQPSIGNSQERRRQLATAVSETLAANLTDRLRRMGFTVERATRKTLPGKNDLVIDGRLVVIDEGSPLRRLAVGFGSGAAKLETRVRITGAGERKKLLEFVTRADSGRLPGAAATLPVGAALPAGLSLGVTAGSALAKGVNENSASLNRMALASAEQTIRYLSPFFARQGWIHAAAANKARPAS